MKYRIPTKPYKTAQAMIANEETGEVISLGTVIIETEVENLNTNFYQVSRNIEYSGILEIDFLNYLNIKSTNNKLIYWDDKILAKKFGVCRQTIQRVKKQFERANYIKYQNGVIFLNPKYFWKSSAKTRKKAYEEYCKIEKKKEETT